MESIGSSLMSTLVPSPVSHRETPNCNVVQEGVQTKLPLEKSVSFTKAINRFRDILLTT